MKINILPILLVVIIAFLFDKVYAAKLSIEYPKKILIVLSNATHYGDTDILCANHFKETVIPYDAFSRAGFEVDFMSPEGGIVPIGYINSAEPIIASYLHNADFMEKFENTLKPAQVNPDDYAAIFYSGGGAAMYGIHDNPQIQDIAMEIYEENEGVIASICHGTAGILNLKTEDGNFLIENKKINGFPDCFENKEAAYFKSFPFSIQEQAALNNGNFEYSLEGWDQYYVVDGRLMTGQDPSSAKILAEQIISFLKLNDKI